MKDLNYLNHRREDEIKHFGISGDRNNGAFRIKINDEVFMVIASNGMDWEHVSISHKDRIPTWEEMCKVKEMFFEDDEVVMQIHPKKENYVNFHPNCLHLWKPLKQEIPLPPLFMV